jgi:carbon monoxide dehydrogenase subunit G
MSLEIAGEHLLEATRSHVWRLLNDPDVLLQCIPGCESLHRSGEAEFEAVVISKLGAIKARFSGRVRLVDIDYLNGYRLVGEGAGGVAGFAKVQITVRLSDTAEGTALEYAADAQIGGKLAQLGQRLILSAAGKLAAEFFSNFAAVVKSR